MVGGDPLGGPEEAAALAQQDSMESKPPKPERLAELAAEAEGVATTLRAKARKEGKLKLGSIAQRGLRWSNELYEVAREAEPEHYASGRIQIEGQHRATSVLAVRRDNEETGEQTLIELLGWTEEEGEVVGRQLLKVMRREATGAEEKVVLEVDYAGNVTFAEGETPNAASRAFWEAFGSVDIVRACFAKFDPEATVPLRN
jgi:hypothetical protein